MSSLATNYWYNDNTDFSDITLYSSMSGITWGTMNFTYTDGSGWNKPDAYVSVENTGTATVSVTYKYNTERTDITGSFDDGTSAITEAEITAGETKKVWLRLDGKPDNALSNTTIGSVKLTIE